MVAGYCVLDLALVIDTSSSIREFQPEGVDNRELIITFLEQLVSPPLKIAQYFDHVGMVTFASTARTLFDLDDRTSLEDVNKGIKLLPVPHGHTNLPNAISLAQQV